MIEPLQIITVFSSSAGLTFVGPITDYHSPLWPLVAYIWLLIVLAKHAIIMQLLGFSDRIAQKLLTSLTSANLITIAAIVLSISFPLAGMRAPYLAGIFCCLSQYFILMWYFGGLCGDGMLIKPHPGVRTAVATIAANSATFPMQYDFAVMVTDKALTPFQTLLMLVFFLLVALLAIFIQYSIILPVVAVVSKPWAFSMGAVVLINLIVIPIGQVLGAVALNANSVLLSFPTIWTAVVLAEIWLFKRFLQALHSRGRWMIVVTYSRSALAVTGANIATALLSWALQLKVWWFACGAWA